MKSETLATYINLPLSLISTLTLIWMFVRALIMPVEYHDFVFNVGIMVFFTEFFTLVFMILIMEYKKIIQDKIISGQEKFKQAVKLSLVILLLLGVLALFLILSKTYDLLIIFVLSLVSKFFGHMSGLRSIDRVNEIVKPVIILMAVAFFAAFTGFIWQIIFPFGPEVWALKPAGVEISGSIQGIFVAMILYYAILEYLSLSQLMGWNKDAWFNKIEVK